MKVELDLTGEYKANVRYGKTLIGKTAQSTLLTMISEDSQHKVMQPAQIITGYEIVEVFGEPTLMLEIGGEFVFEETLRNIK